ncbi:MAG: phosphatase PAP2 family protein [Proteobacteria bacterium]|nr:phosphatase PAP2 family protein [Pseudomonadota bacterium]
MKLTRLWLPCLLLTGWAVAAHGEIPGPTPAPPPDPASQGPPSALESLGSDIAAYYTAPLHWRLKEWTWFGGTVALIAASHHWDTDVRDHFTRDLANSGVGTKDSHAVQDALPAAAAFAATWAGAALLDDSAGRHEAWMMLEAGGLSAVTTELAKYAAGRERPSETTDPNRWREGGSSFPSLHVSAAFAVGTVLAESGGDDYRWVRRVLGYGIGGYTAYARLKHNAHWLSDAVASAGLGIPTARFVMHRGEAGPDVASGFSVLPVRGGVMLTYSIDPSRF